MSTTKDQNRLPKDNMKLRRQLKKGGEIKLPMDDAFYERLHDKIMAAVAETEIKPVSKIEATQELLQRHWRSISQVTLALLLLFGVNKTAGEYILSLWSSSHTV